MLMLLARSCVLLLGQTAAPQLGIKHCFADFASKPAAQRCSHACLRKHVTGTHCFSPARFLPAVQANAALRARGLRDDITIIVVDLMPGEGRLPPLLAKLVNGRAPNVEAAGTVDWHKPLEEVSAQQWRDLNW